MADLSKTHAFLKRRNIKRFKEIGARIIKVEREKCFLDEIGLAHNTSKICFPCECSLNENDKSKINPDRGSSGFLWFCYTGAKLSIKNGIRDLVRKEFKEKYNLYLEEDFYGDPRRETINLKYDEKLYIEIKYDRKKVKRNIKSGFTEIIFITAEQLNKFKGDVSDNVICISFKIYCSFGILKRRFVSTYYGYDCEYLCSHNCDHTYINCPKCVVCSKHLCHVDCKTMKKYTIQDIFNVYKELDNAQDILMKFATNIRKMK